MAVLEEPRIENYASGVHILKADLTLLGERTRGTASQRVSFEAVHDSKKVIGFSGLKALD